MARQTENREKPNAFAEGLKLGFTKFLDVYDDKLDLSVLAHQHLLS